MIGLLLVKMQARYETHNNRPHTFIKHVNQIQFQPETLVDTEVHYPVISYRQKNSVSLTFSKPAAWGSFIQIKFYSSMGS